MLLDKVEVRQKDTKLILFTSVRQYDRKTNIKERQMDIQSDRQAVGETTGKAGNQTGRWADRHVVRQSGGATGKQ